MKRNWDRVRRENRASKPFSQAQLADRKFGRRKRRKHRSRIKFTPYKTTPPPFILPDEERTAIITDRFGDMHGCASFWRRGKTWECVGALRSCSWLVTTPIGQIRVELRSRGLKHYWKATKYFPYGRPNSAKPKPSVTVLSAHCPGP